MNISERIDHIDIAKGFGIFLVILGHTYHLPDPVGRAVFSVHMPLFFILSGYCFRMRPAETFRQFLKKNARGLLLPYAVTALLGLVIQSLVTVLYGGNVPRVMLEWFLSSLYGSGVIVPEPLQELVFPIGVIWFLLALFLGKVLLWLVLHSKAAWLWVLVLFFAGYLSTNWFWLPFSIQPALCCVVFLYLGVLIRRFDLFRMDQIRFPIRILCAAVWIYCMVQYGVLWMVENYYEHGMLDVIGAVCGTFTIVYLSQLIEKYAVFLRKPLAFTGRISLGLMCAHLLVLHCWKREKIMELMTAAVPLPDWVCDLIDVAVMTAAGALILYYIPVLNRILFPWRKAGRS